MREEEEMEAMPALDELRARGAIVWVKEEQGWHARPDEIVRALTANGFPEYKHEITRMSRTQGVAGGVWQGLNDRTGSIVAVIWVNHVRTDVATVFINIDGEEIREAA